jgi:four helix bundle protein
VALPQITDRRFYEIARGSVIEVDSALEIAYKLAYVNIDQIQILGDAIIKTFKLLSGMIK